MGDEARKRARRSPTTNDRRRPTREAKEAVIIAHDGAWAEGIEKETSIAVRLVGAIRMSNFRTHRSMLSPTRTRQDAPEEWDPATSADSCSAMEEGARLLKRSRSREVAAVHHVRSQSCSVLEVERSWREAERARAAEDVPGKQQKKKRWKASRCAGALLCAATSYSSLNRRKRWALALMIFVFLLPVITYLVFYVVFGVVCACQKTGLSPKAPCTMFDHWRTLRRHSIADMRTDIGLTSRVNDFAIDAYVERGQQMARESRVLFVGIVNDAEDSLTTLTKDLDALLEHFPNSELVACESCSADQTRRVLREWQVNSGHHIHAPWPGQWSLSYNHNGCKKRTEKGGVVGVREQRLAQLRNECLLWTEQRFGNSFDYMVMVDLDIFRVDPRGVLDSFGAISWMDEEKSPWSVVCSNGKYLNGVYRDTYAHRTPAIDTSEYELVVTRRTAKDGRRLDSRGWRHDKFLNLAAREQVQRRVRDIGRDETRRKRLYAVDSCYGGLAIYEMAKVRSERCHYYGMSQRKGADWKPDCEHVSFNACVSGRYKVNMTNTGTRIYGYENACGTGGGGLECSLALLNPRMQTWHGRAAWKVGGVLYGAVVVLGYAMSVFDAPLFFFSLDSHYATSWAVVLLVAAGFGYLVVLGVFICRRSINV